MIETEAQAREYCATLVSDAQLAALARFVEMLVAENERQNLVSDATLALAWQRHIADSLQLIEYVPRETSVWLDLGTGAGFPGMAVAIALSERPVVLVESRKRRVEWLESVIAELGLTQCRVIGSKLEDVESMPAGVISARAFAPLDKLLRLSARFSTRESIWLLPKGRKAAQELQEQPANIRAMFHVEQSKTDLQAGILVGKGAP
ncbi:16S rRNA (guanine(527)-N(7))-methyltransferase RsmG [Altererythrobacter xixiisoli]|uniref:Ribosomal RNA small subunit methyltransferase G n=1 Tax=Croceibacterium xixiisoli TaxID=1476466 RepID=A0A6I4TS43_9SPHN|nr:16S rRNA (guanine(527)-N(7))-methyltransferase RsmG [Croceibacterium xixiisoli]MXO97428.1 16S rRNA (guanine(527)-N(7))-methyltransferase RsmG [Croceibacterium xixiisoli]